MPKEVKSLVTISQETIAKCLEFITDVGCVPYSLLKDSFKHATPQQLYRIEKMNPEIMAESDELWLPHCLMFKDIRDEYEYNGLHKDPKQWRDTYLRKYQENERKRQLVKEKVKSQYSKIQTEKAARSIKVLQSVVPTKKRTYEAARRSTMSKLFQQSKREADKVASIYQSTKKPNTFSQNIRAPSQFSESYRPKIIPVVPTIPPRPVVAAPPATKKLKKQQAVEDKTKPRTEPKKPVAMVNFNIFKELS
ncbi:hypothetical protein G6F61_009521 [Rhizopus arrhizus]|nr:hypothetical protein G6F61_009521 [Rhizopus arrhizus]